MRTSNGRDIPLSEAIEPMVNAGESAIAAPKRMRGVMCTYERKIVRSVYNIMEIYDRALSQNRVKGKQEN